MSDHWPGWPDDDPFGHEPEHTAGGDPLGDDPLAAGHPGGAGDLFHHALSGTGEPGGAGAPAGDGWDGWDDGDEPGHGSTGGGDVPAAGYGDWDHPDTGHDTAGHDNTGPDIAGHEADAGDGGRHDTTGFGMGPVGADPDAIADPGHPGDVFPPAVDVGALPEPVDGFPWIDTGSLGAVPLDADGGAGAPDPAGLAEYAAADLAPGVDPWAELAGSDDPATSALARFWHPEQ